MQQDQRANEKYRSIGNSIVGALEANRERALQARRMELEANKLKKEDEIYQGQKREIQYKDEQRAKPVNERDDFIKESMVQKLKNEGKAKIKGGSSLEEFEEKEKIRSRYRQDKDANAIDNVAQKDLTTKNVTLFNVKNAMDEAYTVLNDPNVSEDQKIKTGQGLFKLLNSAEGSDAVGAEEAKRLGSYLEYNIGNFTQPGAMFGRDLKGFTEQVGNYSKLLGGRIQRNEQTAQGLKAGKTFSEMAAPQPAKAEQAPKAPVAPRVEVVNQVKSMTPQQRAEAKAQLLAKMNRTPGGK